jgi:hypothetical protein
MYAGLGIRQSIAGPNHSNVPREFSHSGSRDDMMIALRLDRCKPLLMVPSCDCRVSYATGPGKLQVQPCPQCRVCGGRPEKGGLS